MAPSFKYQDNKLIWESFMGGSTGEDDFNDESDFSDDFGGEDEPSVVMEIEPVGPVEAEVAGNPNNEVVYSDVKKLVEYSGRLLELVKTGELEPWMLAKLIKASDYVSDVWHSLDAKTDFANTGIEQSGDLSEF